MADVLTKKQRSYCMSRIKGKNTKLETVFAKYLRSAKLRGFRRGHKLVGKPDLVFSKQNIAVFLDGCFWHGCPICYRGPRTNKKFWKTKILSNKKRDVTVNRMLRKNGWKIKRFWGHRIKKDPHRCIESLRSFMENA